MGVRMNKERVGRAEPPGTIKAAIRNLEALGQWCDDLVEAATALTASKFSPV
jgi:hypothetical protein